MKYKLILLSILLSTSVMAADVMGTIEQAFAQGKISLDEKVLNKLYLVFDQSKLDPQFRPPQPVIVRCATPIIREYEELRAQLSPVTRAIGDRYLAPEIDFRSTYTSPRGIFLLTYTTSGANAVPATDSDMNGVPDYVEWAADYLDHTWEMEIDSAGFVGPNLSGGDGMYNVSFESMSSYGYTTTTGVDGNEGTRLVLHNNFYGFGSNQDPEGNQKGAMKVTCAHEFKHASQYAGSHWSEGGWVELDATWAEEFVFDYVNDSMLNFTGYGDPFSHPHWGLDHGGSGSYEDYFWEDFLHQRFGNNSYVSAPLIQYFWNWRQTHTGQNVLTSYNAALSAFPWNTTLADAFQEYVVWNFFTGSRAVTDNLGRSLFGYDEAGITGFPTATLYHTHNSYPTTINGSVPEHLACRMIRLNPPTTTGLRIDFNGEDGAQMAAMVAVRYNDNTVFWQAMELDANNDGSIVLDMRNAMYGALIPVVTQTYGSNFTFTYTCTPANVASCTPGDLNNDTQMDVSDLVRLVNVLLGTGSEPTPEELCAADVNEDGQVTIQDVVNLVDVIINGSSY